MARPFFSRFAMTNEERWLVIAIVAIALVGTAARYAHLRHRANQVFVPPGMEQATP